jgi:hypothetical protein
VAEALELLSAELGEPVTFRVAAERQFLERLIGAGVPAGTAELLITREWAILAGENDYTTDTFQQITGRPPRRWPSSFTSTARNSSDSHASPHLGRSGRRSRLHGARTASQLCEDRWGSRSQSESLTCSDQQRR